MTPDTVSDIGRGTDGVVRDLVRRLEKLSKINAALMQRVERSMDHQANAFSLFQTAISLEAQVRIRTDELNSALGRLERTNGELEQARDTAERANRFKTRFFTSVGHDLLQPLHAARLSLSAMAENEGDVRQSRLVEQVDHALSTIDELLRTILDLSKLEAGVVKPSLEAVPLGDLFSSLAVDLEPLARARNLMLRQRPTDLLALSDPMMLRRILQNLLANAVRYTETGEVLIAARKRGDSVRIEVWDTGPGIAPEECERIFEEFQRGAASERSQATGFGLGLAIMRRMAEALGHPLGLRSRLGRGSCFWVTAPYGGLSEEEPSRAPVKTIAARPYDFAASTVLVIDNDAAVLEAMRELLRRWSCAVRFAASQGEIDALTACEPDFRPDLILADYHLERGETGLKTIEGLRQHWHAELPAIVITADHSPEIAEHVHRADCELLCKPVRPAELRALMQHLLG
jgi:signal transduction histidine kinase